MFLDRDGTLHRDCDFLARPEQLEIFPGVLSALQDLHDAGFPLVVLTNQSGIARGYFGEADLARIHARLHQELRGLPRAYFHCPHHPDLAPGPYGQECSCRKPKSGLLTQAAEVLNLQVPGSYLVGDSARDLLPGFGKQLRRILVQTGKPWQAELTRLQQAKQEPDFVAADLAAACRWILQQEGC